MHSLPSIRSGQLIASFSSASRAKLCTIVIIRQGSDRRPDPLISNHLVEFDELHLFVVVHLIPRSDLEQEMRFRHRGVKVNQKASFVIARRDIHCVYTLPSHFLQISQNLSDNLFCQGTVIRNEFFQNGPKRLSLCRGLIVLFTWAVPIKDCKFSSKQVLRLSRYEYIPKTTCCDFAIQACLDKSSVRPAFPVEWVYMSAHNIAADLMVFFFVKIDQVFDVFVEFELR